MPHKEKPVSYHHLVVAREWKMNTFTASTINNNTIVIIIIIIIIIYSSSNSSSIIKRVHTVWYPV